MGNARGEKCSEYYLCLSWCVSKWLISHIFFLYFQLVRICLFGKGIRLCFSRTGSVHWVHDCRIWINVYGHRGYGLIARKEQICTSKIIIWNLNSSARNYPQQVSVSGFNIFLSTKKVQSFFRRKLDIHTGFDNLGGKKGRGKNNFQKSLFPWRAPVSPVFRMKIWIVIAKLIIFAISMKYYPTLVMLQVFKKISTSNEQWQISRSTEWRNNFQLSVRGLNREHLLHGAWAEEWSPEHLHLFCTLRHLGKWARKIKREETPTSKGDTSGIRQHVGEKDWN